jgi:hypothetical protein
MRKRSDVTSSAADTRQQTIPGTAPPAPPPSSPRPVGDPATDAPPNVSMHDGLVFIKCIDCGLDQSDDSAKRVSMPNGASLLHCMRCKGNLDPDEELSPEYIARLKAGKPFDRKDGTKSAGSVHSPAKDTTEPAPKPKDTTPETPRAKSSDSEKSPPKEWEKPKFVCHHSAGSGICGATLTETVAGVFCPKGHDQRPAPDVSQTTNVGSAAVGETVTVCYGEEKFSPKQYNNFTVGPHFRTTHVRPGETGQQARERAYEEVRAFAEIEFKQKARAFLDKFDWLVAEVNQRDGAGRK